MTHASGKEAGSGAWRALVVLCVSLAATIGLLLLRDTAPPLRLLIEGFRDTLQWQILSRRSLPAPAVAEGADGKAAAAAQAQPPAMPRPKPRPQQSGQLQRAETEPQQAEARKKPQAQQEEERKPQARPAEPRTCSLDIQATAFGRACTVLKDVCVDQVRRHPEGACFQARLLRYSAAARGLIATPAHRHPTGPHHPV